MKALMASGLAMVSLLTLAACGSDNGPSASDLVGTWSATSFVFTSTADPGTSVDPIAGGATLTVVFTSGGGYTTTTTVPGSPDDVSTGTYAVSGSTITLTESGSSPTTLSGTFSLNGSTLTLHITSGIEFDFGSGEEAATVNGILQKQ